MSEMDALEARVTAVTDQVRAYMRSDLDNLKRIATTDANEWTSDDIRIIYATLHGVVGLILSDKI